MEIEVQHEKRVHVQLAEILGHLKNRDYGLAETKAEILWNCFTDKRIGEDVVMDQSNGNLIYKFQGGTDVTKKLVTVEMGSGKRHEFWIDINDEKGIIKCKRVKE